MTRGHFLKLPDLSPDELHHVLDRADELKRLRGTALHPKPLAGKSVAVVFEKASTRTRLSFEVGVSELGGHPLIISGKDSQLGRGEPLEDTAKVFSRYVHALVIRTFGHDRIETLAKNATIPVVNALTDLHHPCQILADLLTVRSAFGRTSDLRVAWIGDGNNVANCWIDAASLFGFELVLACPEGYEPDAAVLTRARATGRGRVEVVRSPNDACKGAHVVTTDVWASMGQEDEAQARARAFEGYIVDDARMALATPDSIFLHCLPAHRGEEVAASVIDGPRSRVWDEAENRLHVQKSLLELLVGA
jgi:ornithine carbamoyltransferase